MYDTYQAFTIYSKALIASASSAHSQLRCDAGEAIIICLTAWANMAGTDFLTRCLKE